jgi:uncharacterized tellurite resistance protein B-like protein
MNPNLATTPQAALSHLFFHCCFKDGTVMESEIKMVSEKLVAAGLNTDLNFKDEVIRYQAYRNEIGDEAAYLQNLIAAIHPANELALYSYCIELCLSDGLLQAEEETMLQHLATALGLAEEERNLCKKLMVQRKVVETEKVF